MFSINKPSPSPQITSELQLFYELALSSGGSLSVEENCHRFVSTLLSRKNLGFASVWIRLTENDLDGQTKGYRLAYAKPRIRAIQRLIPEDHASIRILDAGACVSVSDTDPDYPDMIAESGTVHGSYAMFRLGDCGMLKLYRESGEPFADRELNQLRNVVEKFGASLAGALAHERLRHEMSLREELEAQLVHAQKSRAIDNLSAGVAHEFNNLLSVVLGFSALGQANRGADNPNTGYYFEQIMAAGERGRDLVRQLLTFTQGGGNTPTLVDLGQSLRESVRFLEGALPSTVDISVREVAPLPHAYLEPGQVQQLVMNLCINASDAMKGKGRIEIVGRVLGSTSGHCDSCGAKLSGEYVELQVTDTGPGLRNDIFPWMFDPFFTTKTLGENTGLGLSVVHGILHKYGGHIQARNLPGSGAQFSLFIRPAATASMPDEVATISDSRVPSAVVANRIMVVDDEPAVGALLEELLGLEGFDVETFADAHSACLRFESEPDTFTALITDLTMPGMNGEELVLAVRAVRDIPVILCTGYTGAALAPELRALDRLIYLGKPILPQRLMAALAELLPETDSGRA